ncbi:MAG: AAA family ATPase, partial [candidate division Zixibacteria bacterium]|nr:AAA family ATPase [candidate division Zixibacteria bacterium]
MAESNRKYTSLIPFLPRKVIHWYTDNPGDEVHRHSTMTGILTCIDISGFTSLTRTLSKYGREGPEILTTYLNDIFSHLTGRIYAHNGDLLKFAGDAVWASLPQDSAFENFCREMFEVVSCFNRDHEEFEHTLRAHIGAEIGQFSLATLGDPALRLEAEPVGDMVELVWEATDMAESGQVVVGPRMAERYTHNCSKFRASESLSLFDLDLEATVSTKTITSVNESALPKQIKKIEKYIPGEVVKRILTSRETESLQSEFRDVVVMFIRFGLTDPFTNQNRDRQIDTFNLHIKKIFETIHELGGSIARIDPYRREHKLLVLFGAPVKRENSPLKAASCAIRLRQEHNDDFPLTVGMASGSLFCGEVGSEVRKEYTVMGETVNLAARLMAQAKPSEILLDQKLRDDLPVSIETGRRVFALKGVGQNITAFSISAVSEDSYQASPAQAMVGRKNDLLQICKEYRQTINGNLRILCLKGEAGMGKSSLITSFVNQFAGLDSVQLDCHNQLLFGSNWPVRRVIFSLFERSLQKQKKSFEQFLSDNVDKRWLPLLADMFRFKIEQTSWTRELESELYLEKTGQVIRDLMQKLISYPIVIAIDNLDQADTFVKRIFTKLAELPHDTPLFLILGGRDLSDLVLNYDIETTTLIKLKAPDTAVWWEFFDTSFYGGRREKELFGNLLKSSAGNPHFISEFIARALENNVLFRNPVSGLLEADLSLSEYTLPNSLEEIQLQRFDNLPENMRNILKTASVSLGPVNADQLQRVMETGMTEMIEFTLTELEKRGFLVYDHSRMNYEFSHQSLKSAIYSCLTENQRRHYHDSYGRLLEDRKQAAQASHLAEHFYHAVHDHKAFEYAMIAGLEAIGIHNLTDADKYFNYCRQILRRSGVSEFDECKLLKFYSQFAQLSIRQGNFSRAYPLLRQWRRYARELGQAEKALQASIETARLLWRQSRYLRSQKILDALVNWPEFGNYPRLYCQALTIIAEIHRRRGDFENALKSCQEALAKARQINYPEMIAEAGNLLGLALWGAGKLDQAARAYSASLEFGRLHEGMMTQAQVSNNLAIINWEQGDFIAAQKLMHAALEIFKDFGDRQKAAYTAGNLAGLEKIFGNFEPASSLLLEADLIFQ